MSCRARPELSIVLPAYNIYPDIKKLKELYPEAEVIVQEDRYRDGKGITLKRGTRRAKGKYIAWLDADYDIPPELIKGYLYLLQGARGVDVVIGEKQHPMSKVDSTGVRKFMSWAYWKITRVLFGLPVADTQTGLKVFKREVLEDVLPKTYINRFAFDLEVLVEAHSQGYIIAGLPVRVAKSKQSSITYRSCIETFIDTLLLWKRRILI